MSKHIFWISSYPKSGNIKNFFIFAHLLFVGVRVITDLWLHGPHQKGTNFCVVMGQWFQRKDLRGLAVMPSMMLT